MLEAASSAGKQTQAPLFVSSAHSATADSAVEADQAVVFFLLVYLVVIYYLDLATFEHLRRMEGGRLELIARTWRQVPKVASGE